VTYICLIHFYKRLFRTRMGRSSKGFFRDDTYRPQRPKAKRKNRNFVSSSTGLVDRVREMVMQCREEERRHEDREETKMLKETKYVVKTNEADTFQFNKGRPAVDKMERRGVKRNLFGEGERRSSVNRRLRDQLKRKKQSLKSRQSKHLAKRSSQVQHKVPVIIESVSSSWKISDQFLDEHLPTITGPSPYLPPCPGFSPHLEHPPSSSMLLFSPGLPPVPRYSQDQDPSHPWPGLPTSYSAERLLAPWRGSSACSSKSPVASFTNLAQSLFADDPPVCSASTRFSSCPVSSTSSSSILSYYGSHLETVQQQQSISANFSFQEIQNFSSPANPYFSPSPVTTSPTLFSLNMSSCWPRRDGWESASPLRQGVPRIMWGEGGQ